MNIISKHNVFEMKNEWYNETKNSTIIDICIASYGGPIGELNYNILIYNSKMLLFKRIRSSYYWNLFCFWSKNISDICKNYKD